MFATSAEGGPTFGTVNHHTPAFRNSHMSLFLRKWMVALTGLFLCIFLVVHLSANCILLLPEAVAREMYNAYSTLLRESPLIKVVAYALYLSIILHVVFALLVTIRNRRAKPTPYAVNHHRETVIGPLKIWG